MKRQLYRTIIIPLAGFVTLVAVGFGLVIGLQSLLDSMGQCRGETGLACVAPVTFLTVCSAIIGGVVVMWLLLRKTHVPHPLAVPLLTSFTVLVLIVLLYLYAPFIPEVFLIVSGLLFIGSFALCDWLLNKLGGKFGIKVFLAITVLALGAVVGNMMHSGTNQAEWAQRTQELRQNMEKSSMTILAPPSNSSLPRPYSISSKGKDFSSGVTIGLDGGSGAGLTLYEYKYTGPDDPTKDCLHIYADAEETGGPCKLRTVMPSGTKIYEGSLYVDTYFTIKHGTLVFISVSQDNDVKVLYDILDQLEPVQPDTFYKH